MDSKGTHVSSISARCGGKDTDARCLLVWRALVLPEVRFELAGSALCSDSKIYLSIHASFGKPFYHNSSILCLLRAGSLLSSLDEAVNKRNSKNGPNGDEGGVAYRKDPAASSYRLSMLHRRLAASANQLYIELYIGSFGATTSACEFRRHRCAAVEKNVEAAML